MDLVHYKWLHEGQTVYWLRSSEEEPWLWTLFKGVIIRNFDIQKRYYYQCALQEIIASDDWLAAHVANKTFRFIDFDTGTPTHHYVYIDTDSPITQDKFMHDWKHYYAQKWLWDLTADIVFTSIDDAYKGLATLYATNIAHFDELKQLYVTQLSQLSKRK